MFGLTFANFSGNRDGGTFTLADCAAEEGGVCAANRVDRKMPDHPFHVLEATICCIATAIVIVLVVILVVYLRRRRKMLRRRQFVLVPAGDNAMADHETTLSNNLLGRRRMKKREPPSINLATFEHAPVRVTVDEIMRATGNFDGMHVVGDGGFGTVYRAELPGGRRVAVKRLHGVGRRFQGGEREFRAEMETVGKVRHPNLVPLLGYCAAGDERFLVYEYMEHGSLEDRLRGGGGAALGWPERLTICGGAARGLAFLHHGFVPHVIHRDVKSSNVLLGEGLQPRVSDFGLARIISACETHVSTVLAGTLGYIPPEYALAMRCTAKGDVYSFGVVMLELLTGRPPTWSSAEVTAEGDDERGGGGSLVGWVRWMAARGRGGEVFDACLPVSGAEREQMARVLDVARDCTADEPWRRPTMAEVARRVGAIEAMEYGPLVVAVSSGEPPAMP
ncbi:Os02g0194400 [Oryza sativa Japonica Group]|nr:hypothetical protein EE612_009483 [Oryza sativa]BAS77439.1 Os02g0194400 [Oryza sativa Japonica Group]